jgi:hypothetical protein
MWRRRRHARTHYVDAASTDHGSTAVDFSTAVHDSTAGANSAAVQNSAGLASGAAFALAGADIRVTLLSGDRNRWCPG